MKGDVGPRVGQDQDASRPDAILPVAGAPALVRYCQHQSLVLLVESDGFEQLF